MTFMRDKLHAFNIKFLNIINSKSVFLVVFFLFGINQERMIQIPETQIKQDQIKNKYTFYHHYHHHFSTIILKRKKKYIFLNHFHEIMY